MTADFKEKLALVTDTVDPKLYDLEYGNLRYEISDILDREGEVYAKNISVIYDVPDMHSNSINIKYDGEEDLYEIADPKTEKLVITGDAAVINEILDDYIKEIPEIRLKNLYIEIRRWHDEDGLECHDMFNKIYDILKMEDEVEGAILTTEECTLALHYVVQYCQHREANA